MENKIKLPFNLDEAVSEQICIAADKHIKRSVDIAGHPGWDWTTQDIAEAFIAGAEWDRAKMLEEAVDAYVNTYENIPGGPNYVEFVATIPTPNLNRREKVRLIIVKEDK